MTITADDLVRRDVLCCVSHLVSTLAGGFGAIENAPRAHGRGNHGAADLSALTEQAMELASPLLDYEGAAEEAGWQYDPEAEVWEKPGEEFEGIEYDTAEEVCDLENIDPYEREVFEHWAVSDWLADKLEGHGEKIDRDFAGLTVWARTTTGQAISIDYVIERIVADLTARNSAPAAA